MSERLEAGRSGGGGAGLAAVTPVILSGGSGTRLWPMSRSLYPKQLLPLVSRTGTLLQDTARRVSDPVRFAPPIIIANDEHRFIIAEQMRAAGIEPRAIVLEPVGRNTAPAACVAALLLARDDPAARMLLLPSDHTIADAPAFLAAVATAAEAAAKGALVTFGIEPERPETGYGYIRRGQPMAEGGPAGAFAVAEFSEKPDRARAEAMLAAGDWAWNSGMFLFPVGLFIEELERFKPEMVAACRRAVEGAERDLTFLRLGKEAFAAAESDSIDYAVMERTRRAAVVPAAMGWSDVGAWDALWAVASERDAAGNVLVGDVVAEGVSNSYLRAVEGGPLVAALGLDGIVVVATDDAVLVLAKERAQDVKILVDRLKREGRADMVAAHLTVHRPWGSYRSIHNGERVQVKHIVVKPGQRLSLQMHHHRSEHWIVVSGTAKVTCGDREILLTEDQSTYIPLGTRHRLENPGKIPLHLVEVQTGSYLGEDDIVRFEDVYGRTPAAK